MKGNIAMKIEELFDLNQTIAKDLFEGHTYPWEVLPLIGDFIIELGKTLPKDEYDLIGENIWAAKSAKIAENAVITGPVIIGKNAEIRQCAFIRGKAIIGENAVVGNSTELKMLFYLITYRFLIIIMSEILFSVTNLIWEQVQLRQM